MYARRDPKIPAPVLAGGQSVRLRRRLVAPALLALPLAAAAPPAFTGEHASLRWACGGTDVGHRALAALEGQANLTLVFVSGRAAALQPVELTLYGLDDGAPRLTVRAEGPVCAIEAPPGRYRIEATLHGMTLGAQAVVPEHSRRRARVVFTFPAESGRHIWT